MGSFMSIEELERVCIAYEIEHGAEAFLDATAEIMCLLDV
jgi:hypothetical protein